MGVQLNVRGVANVGSQDVENSGVFTMKIAMQRDASSGDQILSIELGTA
jgi:hypothetical protein